MCVYFIELLQLSLRKSDQLAGTGAAARFIFRRLCE